jgi:hypothetical protein
VLRYVGCDGRCGWFLRPLGSPTTGESCQDYVRDEEKVNPITDDAGVVSVTAIHGREASKDSSVLSVRPRCRACFNRLFLSWMDAHHRRRESVLAAATLLI